MPTLLSTLIPTPPENVALYDDTTANFTGTLQNGGSNVVVDSDIGSSVQAYDSNLTSFVSTFTLPTVDGTSGQALITNASGTISFGDVDALPDQSGNSGKYLTTDGTNASWGTVSAGATVATKTDSVNYKVVFTDETSGTQANAYINADKLYFNASSGTLNATDFNSLSDEKYKENIETVEDATSIVSQLTGRSFTWKETGKKSYGVIAQELEQIIPELVSINSDNGDKSVNYLGLIAFLIESNKNLANKIAVLEEKVNGIRS